MAARRSLVLHEHGDVTSELICVSSIGGSSTAVEGPLSVP